MKQTVIIGGGVIGLSAAWALHNRGERVVVLDARTPGTAASAAKPVTSLHPARVRCRRRA